MRKRWVWLGLGIAGCGPSVPTSEGTCDPWTTAGLGLEMCRTRVGHVELKIAQLEGADRAPIAVVLHGDTANGWYEDWGFEYLIEPAREAGLILVAALAPNGCSWWRAPDECYWETEDLEGYNADALDAALLEVADRFGGSDETARFAGFSGGSTFLAGHFLPLHGGRWAGPSMLGCGGQGPMYDFTWEPRAADFERAPLHYVWGEYDFMHDYVVESIEAYEGMGFDVHTENIPDMDHCDAAIDWDAKVMEVWAP